jgi:hypothetical protein
MLQGLSAAVLVHRTYFVVQDRRDSPIDGKNKARSNQGGNAFATPPVLSPSQKGMSAPFFA